MSLPEERPFGAGSDANRPLRPYYTPREDAFIVSAPRFQTASSPSNSSGTRPSVSGNGVGGGGSTASGGATGGNSTGRGTFTSAPSATRSNKYFAGSSDSDLIAAASSSNDPRSLLSVRGRQYGSVSQAGKALLVAGGLQYASTLLAMPFEVGKLLLQIQWAPRQDIWVKHTIRAGSKAKQQGSLLSPGRSTSRRTPGSKQKTAVGGYFDQQLDDEADAWGDEMRLKRRKVSEAGAAAPSTPGKEGLDEEEDDDQPIDLLPEAEGDWGEELGGQEFGGEEDELSDEEDAEKYFNDLSTKSQRSTAGVGSARRKETDESGYVMRRSMFDEGTRPEFVMPVVFTGGVWEMIRAVARGREGWFGLWKGSFTTFVLDLCAQTIQPGLYSFLALFVPGSKSSLPLPYTPQPYRTLSVLFLSHLLTGIAVSPIDLVRTRLVAQSTLPRHRKYRGPLDALQQILEQEGGWKTTYFHPQLLIPTILDFTFRPFLSLATPLFIDHYLRVDPNSSPVLYALWELVVSTIGLCITLPLETVRRRLQVQARAGWGQEPKARFGSSLVVRLGQDGIETPTSGSRSSSRVPTRSKPTVANSSPMAKAARALGLRSSNSASAGSRMASKGLRTCVETRPEPYTGVIDALYQVVTEETTISPKAKMQSALGIGHGSSDTNSANRHARESSTWSTASGADPNNPMMRSEILASSGHSSLGGLGSLYRGFSMGFGANLLVFLLTVVSGERNTGSGWAEI